MTAFSNFKSLSITDLSASPTLNDIMRKQLHWQPLQLWISLKPASIVSTQGCLKDHASSLRHVVWTSQFFPFYTPPSSPSFTALRTGEKRLCCWIKSTAPDLAKRQTALNVPADRSVLWDLAEGIGTAICFGKTAWHETWLYKKQFTVSETVGLKFFPSPPTTFM